MLTIVNDTICAIATPNGVGGIAVIRISGPEAFSIVDRVLRHRKPSASYHGLTVHRAIVIDGAEVVDDVLVTVFHAPHSYTGDDVVEISCHGGRIPVGRTMNLLLRTGCRVAEPGEFTQRAFLNGRIDLSQAEAVCDLINAKTEEAHRQAVAQQSGTLSRAADGIRNSLLGLLARIEASIDFSEDVGELDIELCVSEINAVIASVTSLLRTADRGILLRDGAQVVLVGRPNAGKSSLMNALLRRERAIVTAVPGTTRDTLEETLDLRGIAVRLWDTAGLRETVDPVEEAGISRTHAAIASADLVLLVIDSTVGLSENDQQLWNDTRIPNKLIVWNKCDLHSCGDLRVSARAGVGIDSLEEAMANQLLAGLEGESASSAVVTQVRHKNALTRAQTALDDALRTVADGLPADFLSIDITAALSAIGEITGQSATDDIINEIFSRFCIGK